MFAKFVYDLQARLEKELAGKKQPFFSLVDFSSWSMSMLCGNINLGDVHIAAGKASILTKDTDVKEIMHQMLNQLKSHTVIWEHQLINMEPEECLEMMKALRDACHSQNSGDTGTWSKLSTILTVNLSLVFNCCIVSIMKLREVFQQQLMDLQ